MLSEADIQNLRNLAEQERSHALAAAEEDRARRVAEIDRQYQARLDAFDWILRLPTDSDGIAVRLRALRSNGSAGSNGLASHMHAALRRFRSGERFDAPRIGRMIEEAAPGFEFAQSTLSSMIKRHFERNTGAAKVVRPGKGRKPTIYEKMG